MEKSNNSFGAVEECSCEPRNFELKFFCRASRFANSNEQELNQLVEQRHSALEEEPKRKTNKLLCINLLRLVIHSGNFRENFSAI